jgi:hypothetical protein
MFNVYPICVDFMQILKDGMQHVGKIICSNWGARMDSDPKRWRLLGLEFSLGLFFSFKPFLPMIY